MLCLELFKGVFEGKSELLSFVLSFQKGKYIKEKSLQKALFDTKLSSTKTI